MNFLMLRSNGQTPARNQQSIQETKVEANYVSKQATTVEGLISEDRFPENTTSETPSAESDEYAGEDVNIADSSEKSESPVDGHRDVTEDDGWIIIPNKEIPDKWTEAPDIYSFRSLDRNFVFPGEQVHILACLSAYKQDTEIITPFKVAAVMNKNVIGQRNKENGNVEHVTNPVSQGMKAGSDEQDNHNGEKVMKENSQNSVFAGESLLRMIDHRRQTESLLRKFRSSHFFARIVESNEPLWSKRRDSEASLRTSEIVEGKLTEDSSETQKIVKKNPINAAIDRGKFDACASGGVARDAVKCCSLSNGDVVVLLQVNVGADFLRDPILEILQFEKHQERNLTFENQQNLSSLNQDPSGELLKWLLPLDNSSIPPPARPLSPPILSSSSNVQSSPAKPNLSGSFGSLISSSNVQSSPAKPNISGSSGSQIFSFGNFRSYSMSSLPPSTTPPPANTTPSAKPSFDSEEWGQFSFRKFVKSGNSGNEGLLSFRGVPLEPERFSVQCGLEGIFTPGRRWRRKIEIIQPVEIHSFSADCNTDDLLCVQIKNVSPAHAPDVVIFVDAIAVVFEEALQGGPPLSLPVACIDAGNDHSLPNLPLRRGEEHSFILKLATSSWKCTRGHSNTNSQPSSLLAGSATSSWPRLSNIENNSSGSPAHHYAVLVSCRSNYTESNLFFKQPTTWQPRISRDLMVSVASEMIQQTVGSNGNPLPFQVLTLRASNMTSEDLTMTVLAPASLTSPPPVVSINNSLSSASSQYGASSELAERVRRDRQVAVVNKVNSELLNKREEVQGGLHTVGFNEQSVPITDVLPSSDQGCTHLWLQRRVPLGCVPARSMATIKLEVLPLTDGIITLDSLQIDIKEKGLTYVPEHSLKMYATSSISTGVI
ncbi:Hypothetical predicted protein [Olea europaea subsp. europaea]|uniref:Uncharacterized protein n=1 Tax=Olea europaea subsp. europaea TaxID=158383 RepID=A0A8S0T632_OLEEU|nr:Hypothetical predicted protein [Olea europaea subsp. europaea]